MKAFLKEWGGFATTMTLIILSWIFIWVNVQVDGHSMDPTLAPDERLFVLKVTNIDRFDIVVAEDDSGKKVVKRVIGMPGDTLEFSNDQLTINGQVAEEPYLADYLTAFKADKLQSTYAYNPSFQKLAQSSPSFTTDASKNPFFTLTVPEGEYYLIGDDRIVSKDSRHVGTFDEEDIVGEVIFRFWPFNRIGLVD